MSLGESLVLLRSYAWRVYLMEQVCIYYQTFQARTYHKAAHGPRCARRAQISFNCFRFPQAVPPPPLPRSLQRCLWVELNRDVIYCEHFNMPRLVPQAVGKVPNIQALQEQPEDSVP